jgi:hypothetical protein
MVKIEKQDVLYRIKSLTQLRGGYHRLKLEHVYSHQQEKIASCGKGTKISTVKNIHSSNKVLTRKYGDAKLIEKGNIGADLLAETGRKFGEPPKGIPKGLDAYVICTQDDKNEVVCCQTPAREYIGLRDNLKWKKSEELRIEPHNEPWWDKNISHSLSKEDQSQGLPRFIRKIRNHNLPNRATLKQNVDAYRGGRKYIHKLKDYTKEDKCVACNDGITDDLTHMFQCKHSQQRLTELKIKVNDIAQENHPGLKIKRYWLNGNDSYRGNRKPTHMERLSWKNRRKKFGSMGYFPKKTLNKITKKVGSIKKAKDIAQEINMLVMTDMWKIHKSRMELFQKFKKNIDLQNKYPTVNSNARIGHIT